MMTLKNITNYFSKTEIALWISSVILIIGSFAVFDGENYMTLLASLIGVTSLIFSAKGNPLGQFLMVIFSMLYGIISFNFKYYGEMITYIFMSAPTALIALITWLKNPYGNNTNNTEIIKNITMDDDTAVGGIVDCGGATIQSESGFDEKMRKWFGSSKNEKTYEDPNALLNKYF